MLLRLSVVLLCAMAVLEGSARAVQSCGAPPVWSDEVKLSLTRRADNSLIADARVELAQAAPLLLEYGARQSGWLRTPLSPSRSLHELPMVRLRASTDYEVHAFTVDGEGCPRLAASASLRTGQPPREFEKLELRHIGSSSVPLMLMDLRIQDNDLRWLVAFDQEWKLVWYYPIPRQVLRSAPGRGVNGMIRLSTGSFLYLARDFGVEEITPDARLVRRIRMEDTQIHHDLIELPDGKVLVLGAEVRTIDDTPNGGPPKLQVRGDTIVLLDLAADFEQEVWSIFDHYDPLQRNPLYRYGQEDGAEEWSHGNSLYRGARGNILVSFRHLDQIISLAPDLQSIEWKLGGQDSSFSFPDPTDRFYGQHTAVELPNGNILMFDNGNFRPARSGNTGRSQIS